MPTFPSAEDLGTRLPQDRGQVVQVARPDFSGQRAFAGALQNYAIQAKERQDRLSLQKAKTHWQKAKLEADNAFDQDTDFDTYLPRYQEMLDKGREEALDLIKSPDLKAMFQEDVSLSMAQGIEGMKDYTFQREKDVGLATLDELLADNREIALNAKTEADRQSAFDTMNDAIATARLNSYISAEQEQAMREKVGIDAAIGTIEVQDLRTQRDMLAGNEGPAELIPTDTRKKMLENVNNRLVNQEGMEAADVIRQTGGTLTQRMDAVNAIKDVDVREATRRQVEHDYRLEKSAEAEMQGNAYDAGRKALNAGESINEWIQTNPRLWDAMSGDQQASLISSTTGKQKTDRQAFVTFMELAAEDIRLAKDFLYENAHKFDDSDFEAGVKKVNSPSDMSGFLTRSERLSIRLEDAGIKKDSDRYYRAITAMEQDVLQFESEKGRQPDAKETEELMDGVFDKVVDTAWFNPFSSDQFGFDLTPEQRKDRVLTQKVEKFNELLEQYQNEVGEVDEQEKQLLFQAWDRQGFLDAND